MFRFGEFELDGPGRQLFRRGTPVHLEPQAFDLLVYLVEHRDRVVPKPELLDGVWGHRFTSEASLTTRVKEVRRVLDDDGIRQHAVKNVRGRGYRFVAALAAPEQSSDRGSLIGRGHELGLLTDLLARAQIVTLTGPGGVGKSTLARAIADHVRASFSDGVHFVELSTVDAIEQVVPAVARTLDIVLDPRRPDDAIASIARLDAVLVLDNCEHVVDEVASLLDSLWRAADVNVRVLATSRLALGLSREEVFPVQPLDVGSACELFVARARAVMPSWDPVAVEPGRVAELVLGVDRLPLTIEMAAARAGSMTFDELAGAIAVGTPLLRVSHRTPARRHRSLESLVMWSTGLLDARHQELLRRFSVFAGSVEATDAAPVISSAEPSDLIFDLAALSEHSLLVAETRETATRFSMLATVRTVAGRWLDESGQADDVRLRHAEHFLEVLRTVDDDLRTAREGEARRRLDGIVGEVRAAHRWARSHRPALAAAMSGALFHAAYSSLWGEPAAWSWLLLDGSREHADGVLDGALVAVASAAAHSGDLVWARRQIDLVLAAAQGRTRANALEVLADIALYEGDLDGAVAAAEELAKLGVDLDDAHARAFAEVDISLAATYRGDPEASLHGLDAFDQSGLAPTDRAWLALARGDALSMMGELEAADAFAEAIELGATVGNHFVVSCSRTSLANEYVRVGEVQRALGAYAVALADFERHGNATHAVTAMRNLIGFLADLGDDQGALVLAGAVSHDRLRVSYGAEAERVTTVVGDIERRIGARRVGIALEEGRALGVDRAVRTAADLVEQHLH